MKNLIEAMKAEHPTDAQIECVLLELPKVIEFLREFSSQALASYFSIHYLEVYRSMKFARQNPIK